MHFVRFVKTDGQRLDGRGISVTQSFMKLQTGFQTKISYQKVVLDVCTKES